MPGFVKKMFLVAIIFSFNPSNVNSLKCEELMKEDI